MAQQRFGKPSSQEKRAHWARFGPHYDAQNAPTAPKFRKGQRVRNKKTRKIGTIVAIEHGFYVIEGEEKLFPESVLEPAPKTK